MDILVKGMKMPECCADCDLHNPFQGIPYCRRLVQAIPLEGRLENCPLVEVPTPHGDLSDLINRQATIKVFEEHAKKVGVDKEYYQLAHKHLIELLKILPSIQPIDADDANKKACWIRTRTIEHDGELYCSQCGQEHPEQKTLWNFCPNCGAKMGE